MIVSLFIFEAKHQMCFLDLEMFYKNHNYFRDEVRKQLHLLYRDVNSSERSTLV